MSDFSQAVLVELSKWIDDSPAYVGIAPETAHWRRVSKVAAEAGEAIDALGGWVGENPRKGQTHTLADVLYELLDVATAALGAYEHLTGHKAGALGALDRHIVHVGTRAGLVTTPGGPR